MTEFLLENDHVSLKINAFKQSYMLNRHMSDVFMDAHVDINIADVANKK